MAPDGTVVARLNNEREALAGGWFDHLVVTNNFFEIIETVAAVDEPSGWRRRATRPRWTAPWPEDLRRPVQLAAHAEEFLRSEASDVTVPPDVIEHVFEAIVPRIQRRLVCLEETPEQGVPLANELRALTEWAATADPDLALNVRSQVVPILREALAKVGEAPSSSAAQQVEAIGALAAAQRSPDLAVAIGRSDGR